MGRFKADKYEMDEEFLARVTQHNINVDAIRTLATGTHGRGRAADDVLLDKGGQVSEAVSKFLSRFRTEED